MSEPVIALVGVMMVAASALVLAAGLLLEIQASEEAFDEDERLAEAEREWSEKNL